MSRAVGINPGILKCTLSYSEGKIRSIKDEEEKDKENFEIRDPTFSREEYQTGSPLI